MNKKLTFGILAGSMALFAATDLTAQTTPGPMPSMCLRSCWGARAPGSCSTMSTLNRMIIHHTATASHWNTTGQAASASNVRALQNADMDVNGFCDIEYNWMIDKFGNIFEGRVNSAGSGLTKAAHDCANNNSHGVSLMGYFHPPYNHVAPQVMLDQLYALIAWRMPAGWSPYGISSSYCLAGGSCGSGCLSSVGNLDGHRNVVPTACPGDNIYPNLITDNKNGGTMRDSVALRRTPGGTPPRLDTFVRGGDNNLYQQAFANYAWSGWYNLGCPNMASDPGAVSWGQNRVDVFYRGTDNAIWHKWFDYAGGGWFGPESLGGTAVGSPDACSWGSGHLDVYVRGTDNGLWHRGYSGGWNPWEEVPGTAGQLTSDPTAVCWGFLRVDTFYRRSDGTLGHNWFDYGAGGWFGPESLGGGLVGGPDACSWGSGHLDVYARGTDNALWHKGFSFSGGGWNPWLQVPGTVGQLTSDPSAVCWGFMRVDAFYRRTDGAMGHNWFDANGWQGPESLGGGLVGGPDSASWTFQH